MKTYAVLNDIQAPFEDKPVLELVLNFLGDLKPDGTKLNGDIFDFYGISEFHKNPLTKTSLKQDQAWGDRLMNRISKWSKDNDWIEGNHEDRRRRFLWKNAPQFDVMPEVSFPALFHLQHYGFRHHQYGDGINLGKLYVTHGSLVRKHSGETARGHFEKYGKSIMIGHTHRGGVFYRRNMGGVHAAYENFCLCRLDPEYDQYPNWQQGFSIVTVDDNRNFNVQQIPILERSHFYYGKDRIGKPVKSR